MSGLWDLPIKPTNRLANTLIGGWQFSGIVSIRSGEPIALYSDVDNSGSGIGTDRPDLVGNPYLSGSRSRGEQVAEWLNTAAFGENTPGTFGNIGRNRFNGPGYASTDLALQKDFRIVERFAVQFRAEAFNAFNRPNLLNPTSDLLSGNFMVINSAFDPRILQFALRLKW